MRHFALASFLVLFSTSLRVAFSQPCPNLATANIKALESIGYTVASAIASDPVGKQALVDLIGHFSELDRRLQKRDANTENEWLCHSDFSIWRIIQAELKAFGWGPMKDCTYYVRPDVQLVNFSSPKNVFYKIRSFHARVAPLGPAITRSYGLSWRKILSTGILFYNPPDQYRRCELARALGYRFNNSWAAAVSFTNYSATSVVRHRGILREFIIVDPANSTRAASLSKAVCAGRGNRRFVRMSNGTGILKTIRGSLTLSFFRPHKRKHFLREKLRMSPAIRRALTAGQYEKEMVEDSDTFSSFAILLLPVVLALVPIALFQDTSMLATVLYAVATDVVSVMPIAIKGIELLVYGSRRHYAFNTDMHDMSAGSATSVVETWAAKCTIHPFVRQKGIGLLAGAVSAMVLGILLEFVARRFIRRRLRGEGRRGRGWREREEYLRDISGDDEEYAGSHRYIDVVLRRLRGDEFVLRGSRGEELEAGCFIPAMYLNTAAHT